VEGFLVLVRVERVRPPRDKRRNGKGRRVSLHEELCRAISGEER
jgi:hypothetical protein